MPYTYPWPRPSLTVDLAVLRGAPDAAEVLLIRRGHPPFEGRWALPGGFVEENEPLEHAARRELREETGVEVAQTVQFGAYGDPGRDPRGWTVSVVYYAWVAAGEVTPQAGDDASEALFFPLASPPEMAFDHDNILADLRAHLRSR